MTFLIIKVKIKVDFLLLLFYASPYFFLNLSALPPAVSCLKFPVQNGWHLEHISTLISFFVEFGYGFDTNDNGNVELFISSYNYLVFLTPKGTLHSPLSGKKTKLKVFDLLTSDEIAKLYR